MARSGVPSATPSPNSSQRCQQTPDRTTNYFKVPSTSPSPTSSRRSNNPVPSHTTNCFRVPSASPSSASSIQNRRTPDRTLDRFKVPSATPSPTSSQRSGQTPDRQSVHFSIPSATPSLASSEQDWHTPGYISTASITDRYSLRSTSSSPSYSSAVSQPRSAASETFAFEPAQDDGSPAVRSSTRRGRESSNPALRSLRVARRTVPRMPRVYPKEHFLHHSSSSGSAKSSLFHSPTSSKSDSTKSSTRTRRLSSPPPLAWLRSSAPARVRRSSRSGATSLIPSLPTPRKLTTGAIGRFNRPRNRPARLLISPLFKQIDNRCQETPVHGGRVDTPMSGSTLPDEIFADANGVSLDTLVGVAEVLNHPNLTNLDEVNAMDQTTSRTLEQFLSAHRPGQTSPTARTRKGMAESVVWDTLICLLKAVDWLHTGRTTETSLKNSSWRPIVHNAINPGNVFHHRPKAGGQGSGDQRQGTWKLGDFSRCTVLPSQAEPETDAELQHQLDAFRHMREVAEKTGFAAPELLSLDDEVPGWEADIWSIGAVMVAIMTGQMVWDFILALEFASHVHSSRRIGNAQLAENWCDVPPARRHALLAQFAGSADIAWALPDQYPVQLRILVEWMLLLEAQERPTAREVLVEVRGALEKRLAAGQSYGRSMEDEDEDEAERAMREWRALERTPCSRPRRVRGDETPLLP